MIEKLKSAVVRKLNTDPPPPKKKLSTKFHSYFSVDATETNFK